MVEGNFTLTPDMIWDGKKQERDRTTEEIAEFVDFIERQSERLRKLNETDPLPDDFIEYCKGRKFPAVVSE